MAREHPPEVRAEFERIERERAEYEAALPKIRADGEAALRRLFEVAHGHSGQCRYVAKFLLGCYNGQRFPFDLTDLRCLDLALFEDCIAVLRMDSRPLKEVHTYFPNGGQAFEKLADDWRIPDVASVVYEAQRALQQE